MDQELSASEWKEKLDDETYRVLREHGTERPFSSSYCEPKSEGSFSCKGCGAELFDAAAQFDAGCGWPSPIGSRRYWIGPTAWSEWKCAALPATVTWGICFLMAQPLRAIDTASMEFA